MVSSDRNTFWVTFFGMDNFLCGKPFYLVTHEQYKRLLSCREEPVLASYSCSAYNVDIDLLAPSLLLVLSLILDGNPVLFTMVPHCFHLLIMASMNIPLFSPFNDNMLSKYFGFSSQFKPDDTWVCEQLCRYYVSYCFL